jgi:phenylacetate-CoA ligase
MKDVFNSTVMSHVVRDVVASKVYPLYSGCKDALSSRRRRLRTHYRDGIQFRSHSRRWNTEQKTEWLLDRLRFTLRRAYSQTPYYRDQFDRIGFDPRSAFGFEDFAGLPVLERTDILDGGEKLLAQSIPRQQLRIDSTGGSSGIPTKIWVGPEEHSWRESGTDWFAEKAGLIRGSRIAYLWGHHLDPSAQSSFRERAYSYLNNAQWFDCFRMDSARLDDYHSRLQLYQPECIIAYASALAALAEHILQRGLKPNYPTKCIITGAEKLYPSQRELAEAALACPVRERYGARDVGLIGFQSSTGSFNTYDVDWANVFVEPEFSGGRASILITKLHADGMPMIRYRIGDVGLFAAGSRPGHPVLSLLEVVGRELERIWLPDGSWIEGEFGPHMLKDYPVREYMVWQRKDYSVEVQIAPRDGFNERHRAEIIHTLSRNLRGLAISTVLVDQVPRTRASKFRPVVSEVVVNRGRSR